MSARSRCDAGNGVLPQHLWLFCETGMHLLYRNTTTACTGQLLSRAEHALLSLRGLSQFRRHGGRAPPGLADDICSPAADDRAEDTGPPLKRQKVCSALHSTQLISGCHRGRLPTLVCHKMQHASGCMLMC